jgi:hypothetical protein
MALSQGGDLVWGPGGRWAGEEEMVAGCGEGPVEGEGYAVEADRGVG